MIVFRQTDARYPFLWEAASQPAGRWHAAGEGPAHYFADTPDGAWAEFLRHEDITDPEDVRTIRRQMWAVDIGDAAAEAVTTPASIVSGGLDTYARCQLDSHALRARGAQRLVAPSAALVEGGARGLCVDGGIKNSSPRDGKVLVLFGSPERLVGWIAAEAAHPSVDLLARVNHYRK
jgi:RES domain